MLKNAYLPLALVLGCMVLCGCGDVITLANKSREEGHRLFKERAYVDAAGAYRNAVRQEPRDYESHFYLGVCYDEMGQHQMAFKQYHTALEVMAPYYNPETEGDFRLRILDTLANSVARNDAGETELNNIEKQASAKPSAEGWFLVAKIYRNKGDADKALDAYRRAAQWDTSGFAVRKEFGLYLLAPLNQRQQAEYYLRQAYHLKQDDEAVNAALEQLGVALTPPSPRQPPPVQPLGPKSGGPTIPVRNNPTVIAPKD